MHQHFHDGAYLTQRIAINPRVKPSLKTLAIMAPSADNKLSHSYRIEKVQKRKALSMTVAAVALAANTGAAHVLIHNRAAADLPVDVTESTYRYE